MEFVVDAPSAEDRRIAATPDEDLVIAIRDAITGVCWCFDAWWQNTRAQAASHDTRRANGIRTARQMIIGLGPTATVTQLCEAARPLLGQFWPRWPRTANDLSQAIEALRATVMYEVPRVAEARGRVEAWDNPTDLLH